MHSDGGETLQTYTMLICADEVGFMLGGIKYYFADGAYDFRDDSYSWSWLAD